MSFNSIACLILCVYGALGTELIYDKEENPKEYKLFALLTAFSFILFFVSFFLA